MKKKSKKESKLNLYILNDTVYFEEALNEVNEIYRNVLSSFTDGNGKVASMQPSCPVEKISLLYPDRPGLAEFSLITSVKKIIVANYNEQDAEFVIDEVRLKENGNDIELVLCDPSFDKVGTEVAERINLVEEVKLN